ncbi:MAG: cheA [Frankiales bacterium]|nr:cheA [Frankiales bacterium]
MTVDANPTTLVSAADITSIAQDVWSSFLSMELELHPLGPEAPALDGRTMTGTVHVSGEWQGSVFLEVPSDLAQASAEAMFAADPGTLSADEVCDALGELTNMVGGNIKSLVPGPSKLSIPSVAEGESYTVRVPGAVLVERVALVCAAGPLHISVWKV